MKKILTIIFVLTALQQVKAQQDILVSQYMFNPLLLNPAYAGSKEYMMATLLYRTQWTGWGKGHPETAIATLHGPLGLKSLGWGGTISRDHVGITDRTNISADLAYHLKVAEKLKLGVGMKVGGDFYTYNNKDAIFWDPNDQVFSENKNSGFQPNVGLGAYLYSEKYYFGLSVPTLINYNPSGELSVDNIEVKPHQQRHYYATAGVVLPVSGEEIIAKPSILVKYVPNAPVECDFNVNFLFSHLIWVGASYRTGDSFVGIFEIQLSKQLRLGYSYDFTLTDIKDYSNGSHEIMIGYDFGYDIMKIKTPRYF